MSVSQWQQGSVKCKVNTSYRLINKVSRGDNLSTFTFARQRVNGGRKEGKPRILSVQSEAIDPSCELVSIISDERCQWSRKFMRQKSSEKVQVQILSTSNERFRKSKWLSGKGSQGYTFNHHLSEQLTRTIADSQCLCCTVFPQDIDRMHQNCGNILRLRLGYWLFCLLKCCLLLSAIHHWLASIQSNMIVILNSKTQKLLKFDYIDGSPDYIYWGWGRIGDDWRVNWSRGKLFWYI